MGIATYFETKAATECMKSTKNKKLIDACTSIIYYCKEIDMLRDKLDKYYERYGDIE